MAWRCGPEATQVASHLHSGASDFCIIVSTSSLMKTFGGHEERNANEARLNGTCVFSL